MRTDLVGRAVVDVDPSWLAVPAGATAAAAVLVAPGLSGDAAAMLAITVFCIALWIGEPVEPWLTGLLCVGLVGVVFSTDLALVGFRRPATWLIVLGILIGEATRRSGLAADVEVRVLRRMSPAAATDARAAYRYLLGAFSAAALALAVLVPSSLVRVLILGPVLLSAGEVFTERRARVGVFLGPLFVTYYGATGILTGSLANIIVTDIVEADAGTAIGWVEWAVQMGPVMTVGRALAVVAVAYVLYRPTDRDAIRQVGDVAADGGDRADAVGGPDADGDGTDAGEDAEGGGAVGRMLLFLLVGVAIWATDVVHGLHPLYGALVVALLAFAPKVGVVGREALAEADFSILFFLGAIFAIAEGLRRTGFSDGAAERILAALPADAPLVLVLVFVVVAALALTLVMEGLAVASVLTPVLVSYAAGAGLPVEPVAMTEAVALGAYFFPYQSAVLVAILGLGLVSSRELIKMAAACSIVTLVVLLPLQLAVFGLVY